MISPPVHPEISPAVHPEISPAVHPEISPAVHPEISPAVHPKRSRSVRTRCLAAALFVALSACGRGPGIGTAATINGVPIQESTLEVLLESETLELQPPNAAPAPSEYPRIGEAQRQLLTQLIRDEIVKQYARDLGIRVSDAQVEQRFQEVAEQFGGVEALRAEIARRGRSEQDVRDQLAAVLRVEMLGDHFARQVNIDEAELRAAYEREKDTSYRVVNSDHILVETREEAEQILALLRGGADFAQLARERSKDPTTAGAGGALGEFSRGQFVPEFEEAVWTAQPGTLVGPIQTRFGWHVVRVNGFRDIPFEEVRAQLQRELQASAARQALDEWFREALRASDVNVEPRFGDWDPESAEVIASTPLAPSTPVPGRDLGPSPEDTPGG